MRLSKRVRDTCGPLSDGQLMTLADGLSGQCDRYMRAGDLKEAKGAATELERVCVLLEERGIYDAWMEPKRKKAAVSLDALLGLTTGESGG